MKKLRVLLPFFIFTSSAYAACPLSIPGAECGPATRYDVSVASVALCTEATCASPVTVGSGARVFDIASAAVGSAVGSYANMDNLSAGSYTHVQTTVSRTFTVTGAAIIAAGVGANCPAQTAQALSVPNNNPGGLDALMAAAGITWADPPAKTQLKIITALGSPLTLSKTSLAPSVSVKFGTQKGLMCIGVDSFPSPPDVNVSVAVN
jgi:hypothetical protein